MFVAQTEYDPIRCLLTKQAIEMWSGCKMQITRGFTISLAMKQASIYTGKTYKKNEYKAAIADLNLLLAGKPVYKDGKRTAMTVVK